MPRRKRQKIKVGNPESLEGLMQEVYNDACTQINQAQKTINQLTNGVIPEDVEDSTKIAKEKTGAQKVKNDSIKIKLEVAKMQSDIIRHDGDIDKAEESRVESGGPSLEDFKKIREIMKDSNKEDTE